MQYGGNQSLLLRQITLGHDVNPIHILQSMLSRDDAPSGRGFRIPMGEVTHRLLRTSKSHALQGAINALILVLNVYPGPQKGLYGLKTPLQKLDQWVYLPMECHQMRYPCP